MTEARAERELDRLIARARMAEPRALAPIDARRMARVAAARALQKRRRNWRRTTFAIAIAAALSLVYVLVGKTSGTRLAVAAHDQPLRLVLSSGDVLLVMPDSELVVVDDRPALRRVELVRGSALFSVARLGADQRFEVSAGRVRVRVLGTVFSVAHTEHGPLVHAYEGRVSVDGTALTAPASWARGRSADAPTDPRMRAEARRFVSERVRAHTVNPLEPTRSPLGTVEPVASQRPERTRTAAWPDEGRAQALLRAKDPASALSLSEPAERLYESAALLSADALRSLGRGCEAAARYTWLLEHGPLDGARSEDRLRRAGLVLSAAQLRFNACGDAAAARALLLEHDACADDAPLRERATALLVDALEDDGEHISAARWARVYLGREGVSATSARMIRVAAQAP